MQSRRIVHIHIPKCAGNSVSNAMRRALQPPRVLILDAVSAYLATRRLKRHWTEFEFESVQAEYKQALLLYFLQQGYEFLGGHFVYSPLAYQHYHSTTDFITLLREPVARLKSHIAYLIFAQPRTCVEDYHSGKIDVGEEAERILNHDPIGEWLARNQTIYLGALNSAGVADLQQRVPAAIGALEQFALVGFDDDPDDFARRFAARYGRELVIGRENTIESVQPDRALLQRVYSAMDGALRSRIHELCADDLALYTAARAKR